MRATTSLRVCAHVHVGALAWKGRAADKNAQPRAIRGCSQVFAFAGDCRRPERPRRGRASRQTAGQVARSMLLVTAMWQRDVVCCMPATKLISRRC
jgi:hypothetical protein